MTHASIAMLLQLAQEDTIYYLLLSRTLFYEEYSLDTFDRLKRLQTMLRLVAVTIETITRFLKGGCCFYKLQSNGRMKKL